MAKRCLSEETLNLIKTAFAQNQEVLAELENIKTCRKRSAYQKFTSECMKTGRAMGECAAEWRAKKGA